MTIKLVTRLVIIVHNPPLQGPQSPRMGMMRRTRLSRLPLLILIFGMGLGLYLLSLLRMDVPDRIEAEPVYIEVKRPIKRKTSHHVFPDPRPEPTWDTDVEFPIAEVAVHVIDSDGNPLDNAAVGVTGCDESMRRGGPVIPFEYDANETCTFRAMRRDGLLMASSAEKTVNLDEGPNTVILQLPAARTGGIGVQFEPHDEGMRVVWVLPGTPAHDAGLESGDVILEVAGIPAATLESQEFIDQMTGPEGSDIDFVIGFESDEGFVEEEVTVTRQFLDG